MLHGHGFLCSWAATDAHCRFYFWTDMKGQGRIDKTMTEEANLSGDSFMDGCLEVVDVTDKIEKVKVEREEGAEGATMDAELMDGNDEHNDKEESNLYMDISVGNLSECENVMCLDDPKDDNSKEEENAVQVKQENVSAPVEEVVEIMDPEPKLVKPKINCSNYVWVTNIDSCLKAAKLKCHFVNYGKVLNAKILSNGKSFFGYVVMETPEMAQKCVTVLNNTMFEGKKIGVSKECPNISKVDAPKTTKRDKSEASSCKENKDPLTKICKPDRSRKSKSVEASTNAKKRIEVNWRKECEKLKEEIVRSKKRLSDANKTIDAVQSRCRRLETERRNLQETMKDEKRKFNRERENLKHKHAEDRKRLENDRREFDKQMDEVRRLKEHLKIKIEEANVRALDRQHKRHKSRTPSPRPVKRIETRRKWDDRQHRSPPPPPKLGDQRKRTSEPIRYHDDKKIKRPSNSHFGFNDLRNRIKPEAKDFSVPSNTNSQWASTSFPDPWRTAASAVHSSSNFEVDRYSSNYTPQNNYMNTSSTGYFPQTDYPKYYDTRKY